MGYISIDTPSDSIDISRKASYKPMEKTKGIEKSRSYSILKIILFQSTNKKIKTQVFHKESSLSDKNISRENGKFIITYDLHIG